MKKNNMLRIASVLLVAVLLSTCAISGAFAKYTTSGASTPETARVALFGIDVSATGDAFSETYVMTETGNSLAGSDSVAKGVAVTSDITKLVAPGTDGDLASASITGTAEVAVCVTEKVTLELSGWMIPSGVDDDPETLEVDESQKFYCPLTIAGVSGLNYTSADAFIAAVATESETKNHYAANFDFDTEEYRVTEFGWEWLIEDDANDEVTGQSNTNDTLLGRNAAANTVTVTVSVTVDQID